MSGNTIDYYLEPNCWIIDAPPDSAKRTIAKNEWEEIVFTDELKSGIKVQVAREGLFMFDLSNGPENLRPLQTDKPSQHDQEILTLNRLRFLHAHIASLHSAVREQNEGIFYKMLVNPNQSWVFNIFSFRVPAFRGAFPVISSSNLKRAGELTDLIITTKHDDTALLVDLVLHSCKYFEEIKFELSLIASWTALERLLNDAWKHYIDSSGQRLPPQIAPQINKNRRKKLVEGRDYSASVITEILSLAGVFPHATYEAIDRVRRSRNDWVHGLKSVSEDDAYDSIRLARSLLRHLRNIPLELEPMRTWQYL